MSQAQPIKFAGQSGREYIYYIYPRGTKFQVGHPGLYIHVKETSPSRFRPVYIGQTHDINERLSNHEKQSAVDRAGATHVCVRVNSEGEQARLAEEKDLILQWQPECNVQHIRAVAPPATKQQVRPSPFSIPRQ